MLSLIIAETAIFSIFVIAYIYYIGKSVTGPQPRQVLELPIFNSICLLSSSLTIWVAERALERGAIGAFNLWWAITVVLAAIFLGGTGLEWHKLIYHDGLTISTNLFGTTYYSLVGLHASHVIIGLTMLTAGADFRPAGQGKACSTWKAPRGAFSVLALCRWGLGGGVYRCLHYWPLRERETKPWKISTNIPESREEAGRASRSDGMAAGSFGTWLDLRAGRAGYEHTESASSGAVLIVAGCIGWFRQVLPHQHHVPGPGDSWRSWMPSPRCAHKALPASRWTRAIVRGCRYTRLR